MELSFQLLSLACSCGREPQYPLYRRLGGPWNLFGHFGEEKNLFSLLGFEFQTIQPMA
jgi:hypothetical protein